MRGGREEGVRLRGRAGCQKVDGERERASEREKERESVAERRWDGEGRVKARGRDTRTEGGFPRLRYRHHRRRGGLYPGLSNTRKSAT